MRPRAPRNDGFGYATIFDKFYDLIFQSASDLVQNHQYFARGFILIAQQMIDECRAWVPIATDGHPFVDTVSLCTDNITQFIAQTPAARHKRDTSTAEHFDELILTSTDSMSLNTGTIIHLLPQ